MNLLTDKFKEILLIASTIILIILALYSYIITIELDSKTNELNKIKLVLDNRVAEVKQEIKVVEKEIVKIQKVYIPKTEYITKFVKVENETDCNASNRLIHDFEF